MTSAGGRFFKFSAWIGATKGSLRFAVTGRYMLSILVFGLPRDSRSVRFCPPAWPHCRSVKRGIDQELKDQRWSTALARHQRNYGCQIPARAVVTLMARERGTPP